MIPKSIRWRLPLSYASIALLAALLLGLVLLITLRTYYLNRERDYLVSSAEAVASRFALLFESEVPADALESQLKSFSFLSQTRVRVLDEQGDLIADSGKPQELQGLVTFSLGMEVDGVYQAFTQTVEEGSQTNSYTSVIEVEDSGNGAPSERVRVQEKVVIKGDRSDVLKELNNDSNGPVNGSASIDSIFPAVGAQFGFGPGLEATRDGRRSGQKVSQPIYDHLGEFRGHVEVLEGPAFGSEVLRSVAWGWAVASSVAVAIAAGVGWLMSLRMSKPLLSLTEATTRMAGGELSSRANINRKDELGQLASAFNEMAQRLEDTVLSLRRFVADAAHQLHTPLTALRTNLELMNSEDASSNAHTLVERAQAQVDRLELLSNGLLDLSRIEANIEGRQNVPIDLVPVVRETGELFASRAEQAGLSCVLELPDGKVTIEGDESDLRQALSNLLDNAIKFTPDDGEVTVALCREGEEVVMMVEDTGIGIPEDDLPHLFERFHRGRNSATFPGSGLGLTIVKAIVDNHGGQLRVENKTGGARFSLILPVNA